MTGTLWNSSLTTTLMFCAQVGLVALNAAERKKRTSSLAERWFIRMRLVSSARIGSPETEVLTQDTMSSRLWKSTFACVVFHWGFCKIGGGAGGGHKCYFQGGSANNYKQLWITQDSCSVDYHLREKCSQGRVLVNAISWFHDARMLFRPELRKLL